MVEQLDRPAIDTLLIPEGEIRDENEAQWLGGVIDLRSTLSMKKNVYRRYGKETAYPKPQIRFQDEDRNKPAYFQSRFGGSVYGTSDGSWEWALSNKEAAEIAMRIKPYAPSRSTMIEGIEEWMNANPEERVQIAAKLSGHNRFKSELPVDAYRGLVMLRPFVAGVIDASRDISEYAHYRYTEPQFAVQSRNAGLIQAIHEQFRGFYDIEPAGTTKEIKGQSFTTKHDSHMVKFTNAQARSIVQYARPYLHFQQEAAAQIISDTSSLF